MIADVHTDDSLIEELDPLTGTPFFFAWWYWVCVAIYCSVVVL